MSFLDKKSTDLNNAHNESVPESAQDDTKKEHPFTELLRFAVIALIIVIPIRYFVAQPFIVSGSSMVDTFHNNDYLIVDQLTYRFFEEPQRGDVVIFRYPKDPSKFFIKRIIGLPGDTIVIDGSKVTIINQGFPSGKVITEPYIDIEQMTGRAFVQQTLGDDEYFVMGDNRDASSDSRIWGALPKENIVGRAFVRLFPFTSISFGPGAYDASDMSLTVDSK